MIAYLSGKLLEKEATRLIVDVSGVGYEVFIPTNTLAESDNIGNSLSLNIATIVREDAFLLYGFKTKEEKKTIQFINFSKQNWTKNSNRHYVSSCSK